MKTYFADTNLFIRFLIGDGQELASLAKDYILQAKDDELQLTLLSEIVIEIEYVLRKVYELSREEVAEFLKSLVEAPYFTVPDREVLISAIDQYQELNVDLVDAVLFQKAQLNKAEVLSFDQTDFNKLKEAP